MGEARLHINGKDLQVNGRFQYVRQVGDVGDVATSNSNYTNSFSIIRDNNSTRALRGLGLPGSTSNAPYIRFNGMLYVDELPIIDNNGWAVINESNISNYKVSIIDGNIDFWKAIEGLTLADIDLSEADYRKTRQGIIDSFSSPYQKFIIGYYAREEMGRDSYDINLLNPAISDKYILDQIFAHIGINYQMTPVIDSWTVIGQTEEADINYVDVLNAELDSGDRKHPYNENSNSYDLDYLQIDETDLHYDTVTGRITVDIPGVYNIQANYTELFATYYIQERGAPFFQQDLPINHYFEVNGEVFSTDRDIFLQPSDDIFLRFEPLTNEQLPEHGFNGFTIVGYLPMTSFNYVFKMIRADEIYYSFVDELGKITVKDFIKQIMHRYGFTLFYENRTALFLTVSERVNADVISFNNYFLEVEKEKYLYQNYAQKNYLKMKYADDGEDFNDGIINISNHNLDYEKTVIESFTYSQDKLGLMEMWEFDGEDKPFKQIKGRFFSVRIKYTGEGVFFRDGENPIPGTSVNVPFVDFDKTGFRYFANTYYPDFQNKILKNAKVQIVKMDMPLSVFLNLDLKKVYYIQQENFLINKMTYKGLHDVELEVIKID